MEDKEPLLTTSGIKHWGLGDYARLFHKVCQGLITLTIKLMTHGKRTF